jgi:ribosomal protein L35
LSFPVTLASTTTSIKQSPVFKDHFLAKKSPNQKQELPVVVMLGNGSGQMCNL